MSIELQESFELLYCSTCGVPFAITSQMMAHLRRNKQFFYCPNGHSLSYSGPNAAEQEAAMLKIRLADEMRAKALLVSTLESERREAKRVKRRIGNGVCPCCNRSFADLQKHMSTKHKDYDKVLPPANQKQIEPPRVQ